MQHTSLPPTVATTDAIRDLLGLCGTVVSAYVRRDELPRLVRWLTQSVPSSRSLSPTLSTNDPRPPFTVTENFAQHPNTQIQDARQRMLTELNAENPPGAARSRGNDTPDTSQQTSLAAFATPDVACIVPIPFPVDLDVSVGGTAKLSPLLRVFGPEYAVGLRLTNRSAHLITAVPSSHASAPDHSATYTLTVAEDPPMASSQSSTLSGMRPLIRWLRAVDEEMSAFLPRRDHPVVLLGDESLCDAFATLNLHRTLLRCAAGDDAEATVPSANVMSERVRNRAAAFRESQADADLRVLRDLHAYRPERFCADDHVIASEAASRRIETLFVDENLLCQRRRRPEVASASADTSGDGALTDDPPEIFANAQTDLTSRIDRTVAETIVAGGTVHTVRSTRLPLGHHMAAIFRY